MKSNRVLWVATGFSAEHCPPSPWRTLFRQPASALNLLKAEEFDAVVLEFPIADWRPGPLLEQVRDLAPRTPVFLRDPEATLADAVRLTKLGLCQILNPNGSPYADIAQGIEEWVSHSAKERSPAPDRTRDWESLLVGISEEMRRVRHIIAMVGGRRATVLITGETGTGKELAARSLHLAGPRRSGPWVAVNCSALPGTLLEAELFGHVRGAFTGAVQPRTGRFEQAHGGTLFLDEIAELPLDLQAKLLRVLQEREFQRLGSSETIRVDVRVIAASNCDVAKKIAQGEFREDLYYRLNVVPLHLPPLRARRNDVPLLASHFVEKICRIEEVPLKALAEDAVERLCGYSWPGNVRQLENAIEMAVALSGDRRILAQADFVLPETFQTKAGRVDIPPISIPDTGLDYERTVAVIERSILQQALERTGGNKKAAAEILGLKRTTLAAKVRSLEMAACN